VTDHPQHVELDMVRLIEKLDAVNNTVRDRFLAAKRAIISKGGYVPSDQEGFMYGEVWSRNVLPKGVKPKPCGHNTNIFCTVSGKEVESEQQADISRIRFRKILCREEFQNAKR
jgi:hypothetical protein